MTSGRTVAQVGWIQRIPGEGAASTTWMSVTDRPDSEVKLLRLVLCVGEGTSVLQTARTARAVADFEALVSPCQEPPAGGYTAQVHARIDQDPTAAGGLDRERGFNVAIGRNHPVDRV